MQILFRNVLADSGELEAAQRYFEVIEARSDIQPDQLIIPRYSSLPYYDELEKDCQNVGAQLINSHKQHKWIADFNWYWDTELNDYTFPTWRFEDLKHAPDDCSFVMKGATNSKKHSWNTHMFAKDKHAATNVAIMLYQDSLIQTQGIIARQYIPLKTFEIGANGLPFTAEWRFFFYKDKCIDQGYYWSIADNIHHSVTEPVFDLAYRCANIAKEYTNFFVLDVALTEEEKPILVEINCGTMSGLSCIGPDQFYRKLKYHLPA